MMRDHIVDLGSLGSVLLVDHLGDDLTVVNAARASYRQSSKTLDERGIRLLSFLARNGHTSPFRHAVLSFEIDAPLMVARQWFKYRIGSVHTADTADAPSIDWDGQGDDGSDDPLQARNEASRRYVRDDPAFYVPASGAWRSRPGHSKQGSGETIDDADGAPWTKLLQWHIDVGTAAYTRAIAFGIAPEQARLFLPAYALRTSWRWTASLQAVAHFVSQRIDTHAQWEIRQFAGAIDMLTAAVYPQAYRALRSGGNRVGNG
jgi:thymidylate synthase (FAD)